MCAFRYMLGLAAGVDGRSMLRVASQSPLVIGRARVLIPGIMVI